MTGEKVNKKKRLLAHANYDSSSTHGSLRDGVEPSQMRIGGTGDAFLNRASEPESIGNHNGDQSSGNQGISVSQVISFLKKYWSFIVIIVLAIWYVSKFDSALSQAKDDIKDIIVKLDKIKDSIQTNTIKIEVLERSSKKK